MERRHTQVPHTLLDNSTFESAVFFSSSRVILSPLDLVPSMQGRHPPPRPPGDDSIFWLIQSAVVSDTLTLVRHFKAECVELYSAGSGGVGGVPCRCFSL